MDRSDAAEAIIRKLRLNTRLDHDDLQAIQSLPISVKELEAGEPVAREGSRSSSSCLCIEGFAIRSKTTPAGQRQILSVHIPGDFPDLHSLYLHVVDHDLVALTDCTMGFISHAAIRDLVRARPNIAEVLWRETLVDAAIFREWIVNVGQRSSSSRMAHFILEMFYRLYAIGKTNGKTFKLPMTQRQLGDLLAISPVHVNRVLNDLRKRRLIEMRRGIITIYDEPSLQKLAGFDSLYLHQHHSAA
jgi:CRP-like cAMP-binding protein